MTALSVLLGDYPHTRPVKDRTIPVEGVDVHFPESTPVYRAFARMVRDLEYGACELALATYLQAREAGVPVTLLPVVLVAGTHHGALTRLPAAPELSPRALAGRRVGVRSYSQTTGLWVRGLLREEYGVESSDITWVTTEEPHVAGYREPRYVERGAAGSVGDLLRGGEVAAAVLGPKAIDGQGAGLVPVIPDAAAAGRAWVERHRTVPVNHLLVVRTDVVRAAPDAVRALYRALAAGIATTDSTSTSGRDADADRRDATAGDRGGTPAGRTVAAGWSDSLVRCLEVAGRYGREQELLRSRVDVAAIERDSAFLEASAGQ
jgi:4,5-dihydroxyphthalate decarboxylase